MTCKVCLSRLYHFKFFKGCLRQISLGPFVNTLPLNIAYLRKRLYKGSVIIAEYEQKEGRDLPNLVIRDAGFVHLRIA